MSNPDAATTYVNGLPSTNTLNSTNYGNAGAVTQISCGGPAVFSVYDAAGALLAAFDNRSANPSPANPWVTAVDLPYSGGAPVYSQTTPSSITFVMGASS